MYLKIIYLNMINQTLPVFLYKGSVEPKIKSTVVVHSRNVFLCKKVLSLAIISNIKNHFAMSVLLHVCIASVTLCIMYLCLSKHLSASYIHRLHCKNSKYSVLERPLVSCQDNCLSQSHVYEGSFNNVLDVPRLSLFMKARRNMGFQSIMKLFTSPN